MTLISSGIKIITWNQDEGASLFLGELYLGSYLPLNDGSFRCAYGYLKNPVMVNSEQEAIQTIVDAYLLSEDGVRVIEQGSQEEIDYYKACYMAGATHSWPWW